MCINSTEIRRPAVSVVMSVYNTESYLEKSINSCLSQTLESLEIILVDDGSTDSSRKVLEKYRDKYPEKIKLIINEKNIGLLLAIDTGIAAASGEFIAVHDSDDSAVEHMYESLYNQALKYNADMVVCGFERIDDVTGKLLSTNLVNWPNECVSVESDPSIFVSMNPSPANKLIRADLAKQRVKMCEEMKTIDFMHSGDLLQHMTLFPIVKKIAFINEALYKYAVRTNSAMSAHMRDDKSIYRDNILVIGKNYLLDRFQKSNDFLAPLIDLFVFIHNGCSTPYYRFIYNNSDISAEINIKMKYLDQHFAGWRTNQYLKWSYVYTCNKKIWKFALMHKLMRIGMLGLFLKTYTKFLKLTGRGIKW